MGLQDGVGRVKGAAGVGGVDDLKDFQQGMHLGGKLGEVLALQQLGG